jgi:hypothetical protein
MLVVDALGSSGDRDSRVCVWRTTVPPAATRRPYEFRRIGPFLFYHYPGKKYARIKLGYKIHDRMRLIIPQA